MHDLKKKVCTWISSYSVRINCQTSDIRHTFIGNTIVDHSFNYIFIQWIGKRQLQDETANIQVLVYLVYFGIFYTRGLMVSKVLVQTGQPSGPIGFYWPTVEPYTHSVWTPFHPMYENSILCSNGFVHQANTAGACIVHQANSTVAFIVHPGNVEHFRPYIK